MVAMKKAKNLLSPISESMPPTRKAVIDPTPPIILIMPFASLLKGAGVTSGISEITGLRHSAIIKLNSIITAINANNVC